MKKNKRLKFAIPAFLLTALFTTVACHEEFCADQTNPIAVLICSVLNATHCEGKDCPNVCTDGQCNTREECLGDPACSDCEECEQFQEKEKEIP